MIVYPGHGGGSPCGKALSSDTFDTLGNQKKTNYALSIKDKEEFSKYLAGISQPPNYFL